MKRKMIGGVATLLLLTGCAPEKEPEMTTVPDVVGLTEGDAQGAMINARLKTEWDPPEVGRSLADVEEWVAIGQDLKPGSRVPVTSTVVIEFERIREESTPEPVAVPESEESSAEPAAPSGLVAQVETAFEASYGSGDDAGFPVIIGFSDRDAPRITVAVDMYPKPENEPEAQGICMAVLSIRDQVTAPFRGVYVTAGEGGPFLAECDNPDY